MSVATSTRPWKSEKEGSVPTRPMTLKPVAIRFVQGEKHDPLELGMRYTTSDPLSEQRRKEQLMDIAKAITESFRKHAKTSGIPLTNEAISRDANDLMVFYTRHDSDSTQMANILGWGSLGLLPWLVESEVIHEYEVVYQGQLVAQAQYTSQIRGVAGLAYSPLMWVARIVMNSWDKEVHDVQQVMHQQFQKEYISAEIAYLVPEQPQKTKPEGYMVFSLLQKTATLRLRPGQSPPKLGQKFVFIDKNDRVTAKGYISAVYHSKAVVKLETGFVTLNQRAYAR